MNIYKILDVTSEADAQSVVRKINGIKSELISATTPTEYTLKLIDVLSFFESVFSSSQKRAVYDKIYHSVEAPKVDAYSILLLSPDSDRTSIIKRLNELSTTSRFFKMNQEFAAHLEKCRNEIGFLANDAERKIYNEKNREYLKRMNNILTAQTILQINRKEEKISFEGIIEQLTGIYSTTSASENAKADAWHSYIQEKTQNKPFTDMNSQYRKSISQEKSISMRNISLKFFSILFCLTFCYLPIAKVEYKPISVADVSNTGVKVLDFLHEYKFKRYLESGSFGGIDEKERQNLIFRYDLYEGASHFVFLLPISLILSSIFGVIVILITWNASGVGWFGIFAYKILCNFVIFYFIIGYTIINFSLLILKGFLESTDSYGDKLELEGYSIFVILGAFVLLFIGNRSRVASSD
jgi:hypothetical protein